MESILLKEHEVYTGTKDLAVLMDVFRSVCRLVSGMHSVGEAHGNLSEETILVNEDGSVSLLPAKEGISVEPVYPTPELAGEKEYALKRKKEWKPQPKDDVYAITCMLRKCVSAGRVVERLDFRTKQILEDVLDTGIAAEADRYPDAIVLAEKILRVQFMDTLKQMVPECQNKIVTYAYEYASDQDRFQRYGKTCEWLLYVLEDSTAEHAILFGRDEMSFVQMKKGVPYVQIMDKEKLPYGALLGVSVSEEDEDAEQITVVVNDAKDGRMEPLALPIGDMDREAVKAVLDAIVACQFSLYDQERMVRYYAHMCATIHGTEPERTENLARRWMMIALFGERAYDLDETLCKDVLLDTYSNMKARARIDRDTTKEAYYRMKILEMTYALNEKNKRMLNVTSKRQITIPKKFFEKLGFADSAECVLEEDKLTISPIRPVSRNKSVDQVLEELLNAGLTGDDLLSAFRISLGIELPDTEEEKKAAEGKKDADKKADDAKKGASAEKKGSTAAEAKKAETKDTVKAEREVAKAEREAAKAEKEAAKETAKAEREAAKAEKEAAKAAEKADAKTSATSAEPPKEEESVPKKKSRRIKVDKEIWD